MQLHELVTVLELIAPVHYAEPWDNVGLLLGDPARLVRSVLLTIDYTPSVAAEAASLNCDCIVAYHPPIFSPLKRLTADDSSRLILDAAGRGVAIYSPHTALDAADGGTNDVLADALGMAASTAGRAPLRRADLPSRQIKLVTFVPADAVERVSAAIFAAGAGRIGDYTHCSFQTPGTGTFLGNAAKSQPAVGQPGRLERVPEVRVEMAVPTARIAQSIAALRAAHPYEEPAFDLLQLAATPVSVGQGRIGPMASPTLRRALVGRLKHSLGVSHLLVAGPTNGEARAAACCAGAGGSLLDEAIAAKADVFVTGELRHHDALRAAAAGMMVICTLHTHSERIALQQLARQLRERLPTLPVHVSEKDRDPFEVV